MLSQEKFPTSFHKIETELQRSFTFLRKVKSWFYQLIIGLSKNDKEINSLSLIYYQHLISQKDKLEINLQDLEKLNNLLFEIRVFGWIDFIFRGWFIFAKRGKISKIKDFVNILNRIIHDISDLNEELNKDMLVSVDSIKDKNITNEATTSLLAGIAIYSNPVDNLKQALIALQNLNDAVIQFLLLEDVNLTDTEQLIFTALSERVMGSAITYKQALFDLRDMNRTSYKGVANELRESLRELLDTLAPDNLVMAEPNYQNEKDKKSPTMKQKARYILKAKRPRENTIKTLDESLDLVEEKIASLVRATYSRTSASAHTLSERSEVMQIKKYIEIVIIELLGVENQ